MPRPAPSLQLLLALAACTLVLAGCRASLLGPAPAAPAGVPALLAEGAGATAPIPGLGDGAQPGGARGPGGFVPRGSMRNFYAAAGGRLWYYMNNYYWVSAQTPREGLWIKAQVREEFQDLEAWPDDRPVAAPGAKTTSEYWEVGATGRTVRLDNHKDFCLLSDRYTGGAIVVQVTLTLGRLEVRGEDGAWAEPKEPYVLEERNYSGGGGIGAERARFVPLAGEAVTVWGYRVPWSTSPQRLTRSSWQALELPEWTLLERRRPPVPAAGPVVTPAGGPAKGS